MDRQIIILLDDITDEQGIVHKKYVEGPSCMGAGEVMAVVADWKPEESLRALAHDLIPTLNDVFNPLTREKLEAFHRHMAQWKTEKEVATPKNLPPNFSAKGYSWRESACGGTVATVGRRCVLFKRELCYLLDQVVAMKVIATATYMVYMEDDPSPHAKPSDVLLERSSIPDLSVNPTVHSLTGATSHTYLSQSRDENGTLIHDHMEGVVYGSTNPAPTDYGQSNRSGQEPSA